MAIMQRELTLAPTLGRRSSRHRDRAGAVGLLTLVGLSAWVIYAVVSASVTWAAVKLDDIRYGYPRTFQTDGYIGYREQGGLPTHFTAINAHRQILVLIVPGGEPSHVTVIKGPYLFGPGQEFAVPTLDLQDVNHDGYPDLHLHVAGQTVVYINDARRRTFVVPGAGEGKAR